MQNPNTASQNPSQKVKVLGSSAPPFWRLQEKPKLNSTERRKFTMTNKVKLFLMAAAALALTALPHIASAGPMGCPIGC